MLSAWYGGSGRDRGNGGGAVLVGLAAMALYWVLSLFVLGLSRFREYYADQFAVRFVEDGRRKLAEGLAKIVSATGRLKLRDERAVGNTAFKALFISDPNHATEDVALISRSGFRATDSQLVEQVLAQKVTGADRFLELFSSHPNIVKRLQALQAPLR
jgi:heat shock protein HtpX